MKKKWFNEKGYYALFKWLRVMKLTMLFLLCTLIHVSASVYSQQTKLNLSLKDVSVKEVLKQIENQTEFFFLYKNENVDVNRIVSVDIKDKPIESLLDQLFSETSVSYEVINRQIVLVDKVKSGVSFSSQQQKSVSGKVTDVAGSGLPGVSVVVKGTTSGVVTDMDGNYMIAKVPDNAILQFSFVGMKGQEIVVGGKATINVTLTEDAIGIEEVVAVGYGVRKKSSLTGAVASIKGEIVTKLPTSNLTEALQGAFAGVNVGAMTTPGSNPSILIRGTRSLKAGNDPLVIVDGVPGDLTTLNSYDIASIEVLKDAAATAIYGSRGSNGVILVTTKKGSDSNYNVTYNFYTGVNKPINVDMQSGDKYAQFRRDGYKLARVFAAKPTSGSQILDLWNNTTVADDQIFLPKEIEAINKKDYTDWMDLLYRNGIIQNHYLGVAHKNEKTRLYFSVNYNKEEGYYKTNEQNKLNISTNIDHSISNAISVGIISRFQNQVIDGFSTYGSAFTYMSPFGKAYNEDGTLNLGIINYINASAYNVLANYEPGAYKSHNNRNTLEMNSYLNVKLAKWLNWKTNVGTNLEFRKYDYFYGKNSYNKKGAKSESGRENYYSFLYNVSSVFTFDKSFNDHHITTDVVGEVSKYSNDYTKASGQNQPIETLTYYNLETNTENIKNSSGYSEWALASGLLRAQYDFRGKYILNAAIRADGSSRLSDNNQWDYFPSGSAAWRISSENFMNNTKNWLDELKVRVSYGEVGNTAISPYSTLSTLGRKPYIFGETNGINTYRPDIVANRNIAWEVSKTINFGADFSIFNQRLSGSIELYKTNTTNLIMDKKLPAITGFSRITDNIGETQNKGIELSLQGYVFRSKSLNYKIDATWSLNEEKIVDLFLHQDDINNNWFIGKPISVQYNYVFDGIYQLDEFDKALVYGLQPGDIKVKDLNADDAIKEEDKVILGQINPKWISSMRHSVTYKNLDFSLMLNAKWGYLIHPDTYSGLIWADGQRWMFDHYNYWTPVNPSNLMPKADAGRAESRYTSAMGYMKGDHIKLQEISLGYTLKKVNLKAFNISGLRAYAQMKNVLYLYKAAKYDIYPEASNLDLNIPRTFIFGLNVNF